MKNHPWHNVPFGAEAPQIVNAIIEISRGSKAKYEVDKATGLLRLDRVLSTSFMYPINYGFIPQTYAGDGDPLDILVLSQIDMEPLSIVTAKVIGVLRMQDKGIDDKIIAVCAHDKSVNHYNNLSELSAHYIAEIKHFFTRYKELENAYVVVNEFLEREQACEIIEQAIADYQKDILPTL
jgi:inorganic pyrophosphatase